MPNLNRFPLLGLWAKEAALRVGHSDADSQTIGHAYAVLYAIRANSSARPVVYKDKAAAASVAKALADAADITELEFGGDRLEISRGPQNELIGRVGREAPQTPATYRYKVEGKFPGDYYTKLERAFRDVFQGYTPDKLDSKMLYTLYDQWKKLCGVGRMVDLDKLLEWCQKKATALSKPAKAPPS